MNISAERNVCS